MGIGPIIICVVFLVIMLVLFWLADFLTKSRKKTAPKPRQEVKSSPQKSENSKPAAKSQVSLSRSVLDDREVRDMQKNELNTYNLADDMDKLLSGEITTAAEQAEKPHNISNRLGTIGRMRDYYEHKYGQREERHLHENYGFSDVYDDEDDKEVKLTQDDIKKLLALQESFDRKG